MGGIKKWIAKSLTFFDHKLVRNLAIGVPAVLHLILVLGKTDSKVDNSVAIVASLSLLPLVLFSQSLSKAFLYLFLAVSPTPIYITGLLLTVKLLDIYKNGLSAIKLEELGAPVVVFFSLAFMLLAITWKFLVGAFLYRVVVGLWVKRP